MTISAKQYKTLDDAVKYFNEKLFDGKLPDIIITFRARGKSEGYHHFEKFEDRTSKSKISEIALNADVFPNRTETEVLQTLVHELVHHWQYSFSEPARRGYHDREWGSKMKEVGLYPSSTGEPGGKETGQHMADYVIDGGKFEIACGAFLTKGTTLFINSITEEKEKRERKKTREKFTCPSCFQNAWGKKTANLMCGDCEEKMIVEDE